MLSSDRYVVDDAHWRLWIEMEICHVDVYKYCLGGAGEGKKCTIYILIVFYGAIFRKVFPIVS